MKRFRLALLLGLMLSSGALLAAEEVSKVNGSITAEAGRQYGDLNTVNGSIRIQARAEVADAQTVNGGIRVGDDASTHDLSTVNGGIRLGTGVQVRGGIETVNGGVFVDRGSQVRDGVDTVNGSIGLVGAELGQGIETVTGDITVGVDSHVHGGIKIKKPGFSFSLSPSRKPRIIIGPHAVVDGPLDFEREVTLYVHRSAKIGTVSGATAQMFDTDKAPE